MLEVKFILSPILYNKDPQDSELGRKILKHGILLLDEIGFEAFTFKKLAKEIGSAEKSIYRYFSNKHLYLLFLSSWYWEWVNYLIQTNIKNIKDPNEQLEIAIENLVLASSKEVGTSCMNQHILHRVIINEGAKSYHTYAVDEENKAGLFLSYKELTENVSKIIEKINPSFKYAHSLSSNLFEMANNQVYFSEHLPKLTDIKNNKDREKELIGMLSYFSKKLLA